jgi:RNA recognition motif-containing protein
VKKIFIGQLPVDFVEQDLSDYFSQFGIIDTIELVRKTKTLCFFFLFFIVFF